MKLYKVYESPYLFGTTCYFRDMQIYRYFNDVVAKQWPRPLRFVLESNFKMNAKVSNVKQYTGIGGCIHLIISIVGNRYCVNKKREHKRNAIYFVVNEKMNGFYQKCYDCNCKGYRWKNIFLKTRFGKKRSQMIGS